MMCKNIYTSEEIRSLLYYQGAIKEIVLKPEEQCLQEFYSIPNAYEAMNMLLFDDIESEKVRLWSEKRQISSEFLDNIAEVLKIYCALYSAICKYTYLDKRKTNVYTYRDDRNYTYIHMKSRNQNESFLSSTLNEQKRTTVFQRKEGLTFFEFAADSGVEYLDMNKVLGKLSAYSDEEEILFPPFLTLHIEEMEMNDVEKTLKGINQTSPMGKYRVYLEHSTISPKSMDEKIKEELEEAYRRIVNTEQINNAKEVWNEISANKYTPDKIRKYLEWKRELQVYIKSYFSVIKWKILNNSERESMFIKDLEWKLQDANSKREKYEEKLLFRYKAEIITGALAGLFLTLSMSGNSHQEELRIAFLCSIVILGVIAGFTRIESLSEKLLQRTEIFLAYDELRQRWKYEKMHIPSVLDSYINKMLEIMALDNQFCRQYTNNKIAYMKDWEEKMKQIKEEE